VPINNLIRNQTLIFLCTYTARIARSFVSQTPQHEKLYPLHPQHRFWIWTIQGHDLGANC